MNNSCVFVPFKFDAGLCDTCGEPHTDHIQNDTLPYRDAIWKFMLENGGPHSYGSPSIESSIRYRIHVGMIPLKWNKDIKLSTFSSYRKKEHYNKLADEWAPKGKICAIDWNKTAIPEMDDVYIWQGSFDNPSYEMKLAGRLYCKCGKITMQEIYVDDMTLSQVLWNIIKSGEVKP